MITKKVFLPSIIITTIVIIIILALPYYNKSGIIDEEVYKNLYFNLAMVPPPEYDYKESFNQEKSDTIINLYKLQYKDISEITVRALKLENNVNFNTYAKNYLSTYAKENNLNQIKSIKKEKSDLTCEYKNTNGYYKVFLHENKEYVIEIKIFYKDYDQRDIYLHYRNFITQIK